MLNARKIEHSKSDEENTQSHSHVQCTHKQKRSAIHCNTKKEYIQEQAEAQKIDDINQLILFECIAHINIIERIAYYSIGLNGTFMFLYVESENDKQFCIWH